MAPTTRGRLILLAMTLFIIYFLFFSGPSSAQMEAEFRRRTEEGIARKRNGVLQGDLTDEELTHKTNKKLQSIIDNHPHYGGDGAPKEREKISGKDLYDDWKDPEDRKEAVEKRKKQQQKQKAITEDEDEDGDKDTTAADSRGVSAKLKGQKSVETKEDREKEKDSKKAKYVGDPAKDIARERLTEYLKNPVIIFSKTYCPHSKHAKHLMTEVYNIVPTPMIVELDTLTDPLPLPGDPIGEPLVDHDHDHHNSDSPAERHPTMGQKLQELLGEVTGRRTVPNIIIGTQSIGGNDLIWDLHEEGKLAEKIKELGGKRLSTVELRK